MTRKERRNAPPRQSPSKTPELCAMILDIIRQGVTITELTARGDMPGIATLFDWRRNDPDFGAAFQLALDDQAETLIADAMDQNVSAVDAAHDAEGEPVNTAHAHDPARAKAADQYLQAALRYAGAMSPGKYGATLKQVSAEVGSGVSITITSYASNGSADGKRGSQDTSS